MQYSYQHETIDVALRLSATCAGTVAEQSHRVGMRGAEPLIVMLDALIRYAKAHALRFDAPLSEDYIIGPAWLEAAKGVRALLNGNGALAHELNRSTDSKDNGACEAMFWKAIKIAGFTEDDI